MRQDKVIDILKGTGGAKRAARKAQVDLLLTVDDGQYMIQSNNRIVEEGEGDESYARQRAEERAAAIRALGKTCTVTVYN